MAYVVWRFFVKKYNKFRKGLVTRGTVGTPLRPEHEPYNELTRPQHNDSGGKEDSNDSPNNEIFAPCKVECDAPSLSKSTDVGNPLRSRQQTNRLSQCKCRSALVSRGVSVNLDHPRRRQLRKESWFLRPPPPCSTMSIHPPPPKPSLVSHINTAVPGVHSLVTAYLQPLFESQWDRGVQKVLVRMARDALVCHYAGDIRKFETHLLKPATRIMESLSQWDRGWPLVVGSGVVPHMGDVAHTLLRSGDCCLRLRDSDTNQGLQLVLTYRLGNTFKDRPLLCRHYTILARRGMMDVLEELDSEKQDSDEQLASLLQSLLVSVEKGVERVYLDDLQELAEGDWFPESLSMGCTLSKCDNLECMGHVDDIDSCIDEYEVDREVELCNTCKGCNGTATSVVPSNENIRPPVERKDSCMQTSPIEGEIHALPHIDSDSGGEDEVDAVPDVKIKKVSREAGCRVTDEEESQLNGRSGRKQSTSKGILLTSIDDLPQHVLQSQAAYMPGLYTGSGSPLVVVRGTWLLPPSGLTSVELYQLLQYLYFVRRRSACREGLTFAVTWPEGVPLDLNVLDAALNTLQASCPRAIHRIYVVTPDESYGTETQKLLLTQSDLTAELYSSSVDLSDKLSLEVLPEDLGGSLRYDHKSWMKFRQTLEPFLLTCRSCGKKLVSVLTELRATPLPSPATSQAREQLINQRQSVVRARDDPRLIKLISDGLGILQKLEDLQERLDGNLDAREWLERAKLLYGELERASDKLSKVAEKRFTRIERAIRHKTFEDETRQVLSWLCRQGEEALVRYGTPANNLAAVKQQEEDFDRFYFIAMRHIEKGNDLLEEAVGGEGESARVLQRHLRGFTERLEDTRERLEDTSRCYQLLDRAYEWALEAMRFAGKLRLDCDTATQEQLSHVLRQLNNYLEQNPPVLPDAFTEMNSLANKLENDKLLQQIKVAQARCQETKDLIYCRQAALQKAKRQGGRLMSPNSPLDLGELFSDNESSPMGPLSPRTPTSPAGCQLGRRRSVASSIPGGRGSQFQFGYSALYKETLRTDTCSEYDDLTLDGGYASDFSSPLPTPGGPRGEGRTCLQDIEELRESAEDLLDDAKKNNNTDVCSCSSGSSNSSTQVQSHTLRRPPMRRANTWGEGAPMIPSAPAELTRRGSQSSTSTATSTEESSFHNQGQNEASSEEEGVGGRPPVNSHLYARGSQLSLDDSEVQPNKKTLLLIMKEMIQTERDYVASLEYIIENYIPEVMREDIPQALRGQRNVIFGNIERIHEFHSIYFLRELEKCQKEPFRAAHAFLKHEQQFYLYALYNKNKPKSDSLLTEYGNSFFKSKQVELGDRMDVASYLLKPVQRMGKYALLLKQLLKECTPNSPAHTELTAAEDMVRFQLRHGNDLLAMDSLRECDVNLKEQGRLLRQDEFLVWAGKGKGRHRKQLRHVFLFEELILFSKARRDPERKNLDLYYYKWSIKMTDIGLTEKIGEADKCFEVWFRKRKPGDTYTLQAPTMDVKNTWTEELSRLLWKQALRNRQLRLAEMTSMGIGNKPCLDIKPSEDQISDRSISINQLGKGSRVRSSISSASGAESCRSIKRPHSIISVSSSSGSSGSGNSHYGNLNHAFDPQDAPSYNQRYTTMHSQCSNESGIIPDFSLHCDESESGGSGGSHPRVERSNSTVTSVSFDSAIGGALSPMSPTSPIPPSPCIQENHTEQLVSEL